MSISVMVFFKYMVKVISVRKDMDENIHTADILKNLY